MTFEVGDKVIYPNHGLGIVERIEEKTILGTTCGFYHLRIVANETTVLVPVSNVDGVGLRRAITRRRSRAAVRPARRRQDRQPSELEGALQGQLGQDAQRLDLRSGRRAEEPDVPRQVEEPLVPREAHARSREVPHHLGSLRSDARNGGGDRRPRRSARSSAASRRRPATGAPAREGRRGEGRAARAVAARRAARRAARAHRRQSSESQVLSHVSTRQSPLDRNGPAGFFVYDRRARAHRRRPLRRSPTSPFPSTF